MVYEVSNYGERKATVLTNSDGSFCLIVAVRFWMKDYEEIC